MNELHETLLDRITANGPFDAILKPALRRSVVWAIPILLLVAVGASRQHEFRLYPILFGILSALALGVASVFAELGWGRNLVVFDDGRIFLLGRRRIPLAKCNLEDASASAMRKNGQTIIEIEIRNKMFRFATTISDSQHADWVRILGARKGTS